MRIPSSRSTRAALAAGALLALQALPTVASSQAAPAASSGPPPGGYRQSIATNFLAIPFGLFSAEYEVATRAPGLTIGVGGSTYSDDGERDSWASLKAMYYPNERQFRGFAVGFTAGVHSARSDDGDLFCNPFCQERPRIRTQTAPTLGVLVNYDWLIGRRERFRVGLGVGAKRILRDVNDGDVLEQTWPDGRFVVGFVF